MRFRIRFRAVLPLIALTTLIGCAIRSRPQASTPIHRAPEPSPLAGPIVVQNSYYPKPGLEEQVYELRLRASAVRAALGLVEGRVLRRIEGPEGQAAVIWEAEYPDAAARAEDVDRLSTSTEFAEIQQQMGTLIVRFERSVWQVARKAAGAVPGGSGPPKSLSPGSEAHPSLRNSAGGSEIRPTPK